MKGIALRVLDIKCSFPVLPGTAGYSLGIAAKMHVP